jgi:uncharacterized protein (TIGR02453 family)
VATDLNKKGHATTLARIRKQQVTVDDFSGFRPAALTFLRNLSKNNRKEWFEEHRGDYEREIKAPMLAFIEELDVRLATIIPEIVGSPRKSMFRIHRDVRFSKDKSPYKTHAACWFYHRDAGNSVGSEAAHGGAGFYFHFDAQRAFCGGGIWMPPRPALQRIRQSLVDDTAGFEDIVLSRSFKQRFGALDTDAMLTRTPRGFDPQHRAANWLKYQSFTAGRELKREELLSPKLPDVVAKQFAAMVPFTRWLNEALGLKELARRI